MGTGCTYKPHSSEKRKYNIFAMGLELREHLERPHENIFSDQVVANLVATLACSHCSISREVLS
jgi:hypothetical protein